MEEKPQWIISPEELKTCISSVVLLDVREPEEFEESRKERAVNELDKGADIVVYCAHGMRSLNAVMHLRMLGFTKLRSLEGGIEAWKSLKP
jgi:rhodanese-related sulfurtransferase